VHLVGFIIRNVHSMLVGRVAQSVYRLTTDWTVWESNPGGGEVFRTCPDGTWSINSLLYSGNRVFRRGKNDRSTTLTPHLF
jgi:hypothetical protein